MKIPKEIVESVIVGNLQELWNTFVTLEGEYDDYSKDYELIRYGVKVRFEIYELWEDTNVIIRKDKDAKVIINGTKYSLEDYRTEKEKRRKIMAEAIIENTVENEVIKPR
jgi:hypothetical protein